MLKEKKYGVMKTVGFMAKTVWKQKPVVLFFAGLQLIADLAAKVQVIFLPKLLLDELRFVFQGIETEQHVKTAVFYALLTVAVQFLCGQLQNLIQWQMAPSQVWLDNYFAERLAEHSMAMDFEHTEDPEALDQLAKAKDGISWYSGGALGILKSFYGIVMNVIVLLGVVTIIAVYCPVLLPVQVGALLLITYFNARINKSEIEHYKKLSKTNRMFGYVLYQLADFEYGKDIRLYDSADMMKEKGTEYIRESMGGWSGQAKAKMYNSWYMDVINAARDGVSYFYIGYLALKGVLTLGDFSMCVSAASSFYWSLFNIVDGIQHLTKNCSYAAEFLKFLDYPAAMPKGDKDTKAGEHVIEFCHVSFKYPRSEKFVLRDINLTIRSGEHLSIVGLNGAGKTTLVKLLCRLYDVTEGEIKIDGINIKEYSEKAYRKLFAVVFQDFKLFAFSLRENIVLGESLSEAGTETSGAVECGEKLTEVLRLSGLYEDVMKLDHGVDTMLGKSFSEEGTELSGGQKQKTAIARALYRNAPIVILDEPTAALDPVVEYEIYRKFDSLVGGKTAIYISHRLSSCKFCDHIAVFAEDTIKEYGTHDSLVKKQDGIYAEMFAAQAQYYVEEATVV